MPHHKEYAKIIYECPRPPQFQIMIIMFSTRLHSKPMDINEAISFSASSNKCILFAIESPNICPSHPLSPAVRWGFFLSCPPCTLFTPFDSLLLYSFNAYIICSLILQQITLSIILYISFENPINKGIFSYNLDKILYLKIIYELIQSNFNNIFLQLICYDGSQGLVNYL